MKPRRTTKKDVERERVINWLREVVASIEPHQRFVLQLASGKTMQWQGTEYRAFFQALLELLQARSKRERLAALQKLIALSDDDDA